MRLKSLADFTGLFRGSGEELNYQECPVCGSTNWKVYVNTLTGLWFCFASQHQAGGRVQTDEWTESARQELLALLSTTTRPAAPEWPEMELPPWMPMTPLAQRYLRARGILPSTWGSLGIVEMRQSPRVLVPYRGPLGRLIYWTGRAYTTWASEVPKYLSAPGTHPLYMVPRWEHVESAVLVEGPFDAIAVWQATGQHTVALGGKSLSKRVETDLRKLVRKRVTIMLDADAGADALKLADQLMDQYELRLVTLDDGTDPADTNPEGIRKLLT